MYPATTATTDEARPSTTTTKATTMPTPTTTPSVRPKSKPPRQRPPKTALGALRMIVVRLDYFHPATGSPVSLEQLAEMVSGEYGTRGRRRRTSEDTGHDHQDLIRQPWWGNEAGEVMGVHALAKALRKYHPETAVVIDSHHTTVGQRERQRSCRQRKADEAQKAKRREASRERRKREKAAKMARIPELEARAFQIRQEQRDRERAARESAHAGASTPSTTPTTTDEAPAPPPRD